VANPQECVVGYFTASALHIGAVLA
jgi:hypothetical protein